MELDVIADRAIVKLVVRTLTGVSPTTPSRRGPYAPPACSFEHPPCKDLQSTEVGDLCRALLDALLVGDADVAALADELAPDVVLWTPGTFAASSAAALEVLMAQDWDSGPLSERVVTVTNTDVAPPRVILEWRTSGRFTHPFFVADDVLVEPSGQLVETGGVLVVTFGGRGVVAVHLYHDAFAVFEQLLAR